VALAFVMIEKNAGGTVQLADHDTLGTVDDKGPLFGHQRNGAEINLLLLDVADVGNPVSLSTS
jgi:hypothetical protein